MAQLLLDLQPKWGWQLAIAHCNHRWAVDSPELPGHVRAIAEQWALPFYLVTAPDEVAADNREASARAWRYEVLTTLAIAHGFSCVTTGHTASDRAETLMYNLLRGSGIDGLSALGWHRPLTDTLTLVRPLLTVTRAETGAFCHQRNLPVWDDPANTDLNYARNRIRNDVLPYLTQHFNPNLEQTLATTVEVIQADVDYLEAEVDRLLHDVLEIHSSPPHAQLPPHTTESALPPSLRIQRRRLKDVPLSLQRRVMRRCLQTLLPRSPTFDHIEKLTALITAPNRSQTDPFPGGAIARVNGDWIEVYAHHSISSSQDRT
jgi:tRNA(Ile)-lysidine synthase